jgi:hypothetical protein
MISREKIFQSVELVRELNGSLSLSYIPSSVLDSSKSVGELYYGGWTKMEVSKTYFNDYGGLDGKIDKIGLNRIIDHIYDRLQDSIGPFIMKALENLNLDDSDLKYFDRDPQLFKRFQEEVLKLKSQNV